MDGAKGVPALWDVIPQLFLIPLKGAGVVVLLAFSALAAVLSPIFFQIMLLFAVIKYGMEILQHTAKGQLEAPELSFKVLNENYQLPFKQLGLFLLPIILFYQADSFIAFIIVSNIIIFYLFALPASVMTLAYTHSFFSAINPFTLTSLIGRIGWTYGILYVFLLFLNGGASVAYYFLFDDSTASVFFEILFQMYFTWVMYAMMGYVLYQYHEEIGYDLPADKVKFDEHGVDLTDFNQLVEDENYQVAQAVLRDIILQNPDNLDLRKKFHKLVKMSGDDEQLTAAAIATIGRLIDSKQLVDAVNIYLDCLKVDAGFRPESPVEYLPLVEEMRRMRLYKQAVELSSGFHQRYPRNEYIPHVYLLVSKILIEDLSQNDKAKLVLSFLKKKYVGHEIEMEVESYNKFLSRMRVRPVMK